MTDKIVPLFSKAGEEAAPTRDEVGELLEALLKDKQEIKEILVVTTFGDGSEVAVSSNGLKRETAYYLLSVARDLVLNS